MAYPAGPVRANMMESSVTCVWLWTVIQAKKGYANTSEKYHDTSDFRDVFGPDVKNVMEHMSVTWWWGCTEIITAHTVQLLACGCHLFNNALTLIVVFALTKNETKRETHVGKAVKPF